VGGGREKKKKKKHFQPPSVVGPTKSHIFQNTKKKKNRRGGEGCGGNSPCSGQRKTLGVGGNKTKKKMALSLKVPGGAGPLLFALAVFLIWWLLWVLGLGWGQRKSPGVRIRPLFRDICIVGVGVNNPQGSSFFAPEKTQNKIFRLERLVWF